MTRTTSLSEVEVEVDKRRPRPPDLGAVIVEEQQRMTSLVVPWWWWCELVVSMGMNWERWDCRLSESRGIRDYMTRERELAQVGELFGELGLASGRIGGDERRAGKKPENRQDRAGLCRSEFFPV
ncbi:hypothetical protein ACLB2K_020411 [Fragaria x ananassa]